MARAEPARADRVAWGIALAALALALPLRLWGFVGFGLGDDPNFAAAFLDYLIFDRLDPANAYHLRPLFILPHALSLHLLGMSELALVLPTLLAALGTHALGTALAGAAFGARGAAFASLLWLTTPFETLTATALAPGHGVAFFLMTACACCFVGSRGGHAGWMVLGALGVLAGAAVKVPALAILPSLALATGLAGSGWRRWLPFWGVLALAATLAALALVTRGGPATLDWLAGLAERSVPRLDAKALGTYPRLLWGQDPQGQLQFGVAAWLALGGAALACVRADARGRGVALVAASAVAVFLVAAGASRFPLIFRYLTQIAPALYLCGAFCLSEIARRSPRTATVGIVLAAAFGLQRTPAATESLRDPNADGRALTAFVAALAPPPHTVIQGDFWTCERLRWLLHPASNTWTFRCPSFRTWHDKRAFLEDLDTGLLVTGGATLAWYSSDRWPLGLELARFRYRDIEASPARWELLLEHDGPRRRWRREPLRVWRITRPGGDRRVEIPDPALRRCLRRIVFPDAADPDADPRPLTEALAAGPERIHCARAEIRDATGIGYFVNARELVLSHNALESIDLSGLRSLRVAALNGNALRQVDGLQGANALERLWLQHNRLTTLQLGALPRLRDLRLDGNALEALALEPPLRRLHTLTLWANPALACTRLRLDPKLLRGSGCGGPERPKGLPVPELDALEHGELTVLLGSFGQVEDRPETLAHALALVALQPSAANLDQVGLVYQNLGDLEPALEQHTQALRVDPGYAYAYRHRGLALLGLGRNEAARADFERYAETAGTPTDRAEARMLIERARSER